MHCKRPLIHVAHPDIVVSAGLVSILSRQSGFDITTDGGAAACSRADVVVTDHAGGIELARQRAEHAGPGPHILVVTSCDKEAQVRNALDAGVYGYLLQDCSADDLHDAVQRLSEGLRYLSDRVSKSIADSLTRVLLTPRESDVLQLLAGGHCNKLIARELGIGVGTVKTHIKGLLTKLDAKARTHAVVIAAQRGLVDAGMAGLA